MRCFAVALPIILMTAVATSGCLAPHIPPDALVDTFDGLPGATLSAWLEAKEGYVTVHGVFENDSGRLLTVYQGYHLGSWNLSIVDPAGAPIIIDERLSCTDYYYDFLADGDHDTFRFSWTYKQYERFAHCQSGEALVPSPAPGGEYTIRLGYRIQDIPDGAFHIDMPITVPEPGAAAA